jgi:chromosome segregation ATPase
LKEQMMTWQDRQLQLYAVAQQRESRVVDELRARIEERREKARAMTGRLDVSPEAIRTAAAKLEDLRTTLELDAAGGAARRKAIEEGIARIGDREEKRVKEDPAAVELDKVVKAREQMLERLQKAYEAAQVSAADVGQAQAAVAEAKARVAIRRSDVATATGGELLAQLNRELTMLSIDTLEKRVRLELIEKQLARLKDVPALLDGIEADQAALSRALVRLEAVIVQSQDLERRLASMRPPMFIVQRSEP